MHSPRVLSVIAPVAALAIAVVSCADGVAPPVASGPVATIGRASHVGCSGVRFTGGGRVDPGGVGTVTFGFNVDGRAFCDGTGPARGQIEVVYHEGMSIMHVARLTSFASFIDEAKGVCGEWDGDMRIKDVNVSDTWYEKHFYMLVCDNGEPGKGGVDNFNFYIDNAGDGLHNNVIDEPLTGGNIQAHTR
jgi:hypothetical protein